MPSGPSCCTGREAGKELRWPCGLVLARQTNASRHGAEGEQDGLDGTGPRSLARDSNPSSATSSCNLEQVTKHLCASLSPSVNWG